MTDAETIDITSYQLPGLLPGISDVPNDSVNSAMPDVSQETPEENTSTLEETTPYRINSVPSGTFDVPSGALDAPQLAPALVPSGLPSQALTTGAGQPIRLIKFYPWQSISPSKLSQYLTKLAWISLGAAGLILAATLGPRLIQSLKSTELTAIGKILIRPGATFGDALKSAGQTPVEPYQPAFDPTLSPENWLIVDSIGVNSAIGENTYANLEETLRDGPWRVPDFGTPFTRENPTIIAAHRYGYLAWTNQYRRERSFFNLPKVKEGDRIEVVWNRRKYIYEVYADSEGEEITDYRADLILYTCKFLDSDTRIFKYAKLLEI